VVVAWYGDGAGEDGVGGEEAGHGNEQARGVQSDLLEMSVEEMPVRFGCYRFRSPDKWEECEEGMRIGFEDAFSTIRLLTDSQHC